MNDYRFGNFIYELRIKKGYTQAYVAKELGVTPAAVSKWENGSAKPRYEALLKLAELLDVSSEELIAGEHIEAQEQAPVVEAPKPQKREVSVALVIAIVALCIALVVFCVGYLFIIKNADSNANANSNSQGYCSVVKHGNWIYYCNINRDGDIYKIRTDGKEKQHIVECTAISVGVTDDWIYYCEENRYDGKAGIYRVKHDGTEKELLTAGAFWYIYATDEWVYYVNGDRASGGDFYRMKPDGTRAKKITEHLSSNISFVDGFIYYMNKTDNYVYKLDPETGEKQRFDPRQKAEQAIVEEGFLYTYHDSTLKRTSLDGKNSQEYKQSGVVRFVVNDGCIYFVKNYYNRAIFYKLSSDMTERTEILHMQGQFPDMYMCIIDDWLYFPYSGDGYRMYRARLDGSREIELVN